MCPGLSGCRRRVLFCCWGCFTLEIFAWGWICAGDGMKRKGKYAGDGLKRGSSLVMGTRRVPILVTRRYDAVNAIYGQGFFFSFPFLPSSIRFISHSATAPYGNVQGLLAPSTLGRGGTPLHPEERKAFLIRLRRCIHYRHHPLYCISSSPFTTASPYATISMHLQSRGARVKCPLDGELPVERKAGRESMKRFLPSLAVRVPHPAVL